MAKLFLIKTLAEKKNISMVELANKVGISEQQIHLLVRKNSTKIETLEKIANVLQVPVAYFFEDKTHGNVVSGDYSQLNTEGAHDNINGIGGEILLIERVKSLERLVAEKDERIKELKERIEELKEGRK